LGYLNYDATTRICNAYSYIIYESMRSRHVSLMSIEELTAVDI
jgi:hypothetical protein